MKFGFARIGISEVRICEVGISEVRICEGWDQLAFRNNAE